MPELTFRQNSPETAALFDWHQNLTSRNVAELRWRHDSTLTTIAFSAGYRRLVYKVARAVGPLSEEQRHGLTVLAVASNVFPGQQPSSLTLPQLLGSNEVSHTRVRSLLQHDTLDDEFMRQLTLVIRSARTTPKLSYLARFILNYGDMEKRYFLLALYQPS